MMAARLGHVIEAAADSPPRALAGCSFLPQFFCFSSSCRCRFLAANARCDGVLPADRCSAACPLIPPFTVSHGTFPPAAPADNLNPSGYKFGETMGFGLPPWVMWILVLIGFGLIGYLVKTVYDLQAEDDSKGKKDKKKDKKKAA